MHFLLWSFFLGGWAYGNQIVLEVNGIQREEGQLVCQLYQGEESFLKENKELKRLTQPIKAGPNICDFVGLPPGEYAASVFHDQDKDGELDSNFIGIPTEPVAVTNNAKGSFGPPKYKDAKVTLREEPLKLSVTLPN